MNTAQVFYIHQSITRALHEALMVRQRIFLGRSDKHISVQSISHLFIGRDHTGRHIRGNCVHTLFGQLQPNLQQFRGNVSIRQFELLVLLPSEKPGYGIFLRSDSLSFVSQMYN